MQRAIFSLLVSCLAIFTACTRMPQQSKPISSPIAEEIATQPSQTMVDTPLPAATLTIKAMGTSLLVNVPKCDGLEVLEEPVFFSWPNIESHLEKLETDGALWGYYLCNLLQSDAAAFYRAQLSKLPYRYMETNWVDRTEGSVGVYYVWEATWMYVWTVPVQNEIGKSYLIIAISSSQLDC
jgi:hypothetical protein